MIFLLVLRYLLYLLVGFCYPIDLFSSISELILKVSYISVFMLIDLLADISFKRRNCCTTFDHCYVNLVIKFQPEHFFNLKYT